MAAGVADERRLVSTQTVSSMSGTEAPVPAASSGKLRSLHTTDASSQPARGATESRATLAKCDTVNRSLVAVVGSLSREKVDRPDPSLVSAVTLKTSFEATSNPFASIVRWTTRTVCRPSISIVVNTQVIGPARSIVTPDRGSWPDG